MPLHILHLTAIIFCLAYCCYCVARALGEKDAALPAPVRDRDESSAELDEETKRARAALYLARFGERGKSVTNTALLWVAALTIVWMTGIEGLRRDVATQFGAIKESNRARQKLENEAATYHLSQGSLTRRIKVLRAHIEEEGTLGDLREALRKAQGNEAELLRKKIERIEKRIEEEGPTEQRSEVLKKLESGKDAKAEQFKNQFAKIETKRGELQQSLRTLKEKRRAVSFDILGQKFDTPAVYAPVIWCLFLLGLILYLARARASLITLSVKALASLRSIPSTSPGHLKNIIADAPWWLAPLPPGRVRLEHLAGDAEAGRGALRSGQLLEAVGWSRRQHRLLSLLSASCLSVLMLAQVYMAWLGLGMSRQIGDAYERSYVPAVFLAVLVLTGYAVRLWLSPTPEPSDPERGRGRVTFSGTLLLVAAFGVLLLFALTWAYPRAGEVVRRQLEASLSTIIILSLVAAAALAWRLWAQAGADDDAEGVVERVTDAGRRRVFFGAVFAVGAIALGSLLFRSKKETQKRATADEPRPAEREKKRSVIDSELGHGFHLNKKTGIIHYVTAAGSLSGVPHKANINRENFVPSSTLSVSTQDDAGAAKAPSDSSSDETDGDDKRIVAADGDDKRSDEADGGAKQLVAVARADDSEPTTGAPPVSADQQTQPVFGPDFFLLSGGESELSAAGLRRSRSDKRPRVNLARSSWALEQAVLSALRKPSLKAQDYARACDLLLDAVKHDLYFKSKQRKLPSFRLYDLLAGLSVRSKKEAHLAELIKLVDDAGNDELFRSRKEKWGNTDGDWHKEWSDRRRPRRWAGLSL